jgi:hypothetical protein
VCVCDMWISALTVLDCVRMTLLLIQQTKQKIERLCSTYQTWN